jgi:RNA recognition motif-containing protein
VNSFCEFRDVASAASAVRNISNVDFHGRTLRVDFTDGEQRYIDIYIYIYIYIDTI